MAVVREGDDWGFDAEIVVPVPLPPELVAVEPAPADMLPTKESWRNRTVVAMAVLLVFVVEVGWLVALGYGIGRTVLS